jgi:hypothetical protein
MFIEYIPIATAAFSVFFFIVIWNHYRTNPKQYLLWWAIGVFTFGFGTITEAVNATLGWNEVNFRLWYISGALLGGFPLAQGSVYLLMSKKFSDASTIIVTGIIVLAAVCVLFSPITLPPDFDGKLGGKVLAWQWVRYFSPFINTYSFIFLVGGAVYSSVLYMKQADKKRRFIGNVFIAIGALLPGIGGSFTRAGYVNVLFVTELIGLLLIFVGYTIIKKDSSASLHSKQVKTV